MHVHATLFETDYAISPGSETISSLLIENHVITSVQVKVKSFRPDTSGLLQLFAVSMSSLAPCVSAYVIETAVSFGTNSTNNEQSQCLNISLRPILCRCSHGFLVIIGYALFGIHRVY